MNNFFILCNWFLVIAAVCIFTVSLNLSIKL